MAPHRCIYNTHSDAPQSVGLLWTSGQLVAETSTKQHTTLTTYIHAPGGIRTHDLSRQAGVDLRLRPRGHCDRLFTSLVSKLFLWQSPRPLLYVGSRAARGKIRASGIPNSLNYWIVFIVYAQFTNVAAGRIIQPDRPQVGDPCFTLRPK